MASFEEAWAYVSGPREGESVSRELKPLLHDVYREIMRKPSNLPALKAALERLLSFLALPPGRTNANCWATDLFFGLGEGWEGDWEHLPNDFGDALAYMGGALHDTVSHPEIAANFDSLPEQLLERVRRLVVGDRTV